VDNYPAITIDTAADELNRLHAGIEGKMRSTVQDAIRAGEILSQVKERLRHGDFLPWITANCRFSNKTAEKYIAVNKYARKIESSSNLQEAYAQIETLEAQARQSEEQRARARIDEFKRTGTKPEGWRRGTDDNIAQDEIGRDARVKKMQADLLAEHETLERSAPKKRINIGESIQSINELVGAIAEHTKKRVAFKERIRISSEGEKDAFIDALMDYLDELDDDNRRIEACYNIIKVCKNIAIEIQGSNT